MFLTVPVVPQSVPSKVSLKEARTVSIDNRTSDKWIPRFVRVALVDSGLREIIDKEKADLVLTYDRDALPAKRTVVGDEIRIQIENTYTLEVMDRFGESRWKGSEVLGDLAASNSDKHPSAEDNPIVKLTREFLRDRNTK